MFKIVKIIYGFMSCVALAAVVGCGQRSDTQQASTVDIWTAAATGNMEAIQEHLANGTDMSLKRPTGITPLMVAVLADRTEVVRLLVENGARIDSRFNDGSTPLHMAAIFGHTNSAILLLQMGANVNAVNRNGQTPLDVISIVWDTKMNEAYREASALFAAKPDLDQIKAARPQMAALLCRAGGRNSSDWSNFLIVDSDGQLWILTDEPGARYLSYTNNNY